MPAPKTDASRLQKTLDDIVRFTLALPDVAESTAYGQPALKRSGKLIFTLRKDLETLAMVCGFEKRATLMRTHPGTFFITDHYLNWPAVVVRLDGAHKKVLRAAATAAWEFAGAKASKKRTPASRRSPPRR
ncbi:MAG: MmcQ/YjbR family DNA-binding protein [Vicinamibacteria bacterium]